jgi:hypothetical protein
VAHGGKRNGAGRKPGSRTEKRRPIAGTEMIRGLTPYEVMEDVMWREYEAGNYLQAAAIAKDCAPYKHPRLAAVAHTGEEVRGSSVSVHVNLNGVQTDVSNASADDLSRLPRDELVRLHRETLDVPHAG